MRELFMSLSTRVLLAAGCAVMIGLSTGAMAQSKKATEVTSMGEGEAVMIGSKSQKLHKSNAKVTAAETTHFEFHTGAAAGKHKSYAYRFEAPDRVVVFTGDTGPNDALTNLAKDADVLVAEGNSIEERMQGLIRSGQWQAMTPAEQAGIRRQMTQGHLSPDDVGKMAARARVKSVVLTHLTAKPDNDYTAWANEVKNHFSGEVLIAKDLMEF